jgi:hypothetical protein
MYHERRNVKWREWKRSRCSSAPSVDDLSFGEFCDTLVEISDEAKKRFKTSEVVYCPQSACGCDDLNTLCIRIMIDSEFSRTVYDSRVDFGRWIFNTYSCSVSDRIWIGLKFKRRSSRIHVMDFN